LLGDRKSNPTTFPNALKYGINWSIEESSNYPDLLDAGVEELVAGLESGAFTSVDLTKAYILRIEEVNSVLHAVTEINPDALSIAAGLDAERGNGTIRSALHGLPMLIKNNIATKDGMNNTAGSHSLLGATVPRDATVAGKLRDAGAVLLGKSNLSQWANFRSVNSSNGWSAHGGQVTGAYYPDMDPSGSSSGSGVASSVGLAVASLGTETAGSILCPASVNNLVGIKPTVGLTSRSLVIPISSHQDTVGPSKCIFSVWDYPALLLASSFTSPADFPFDSPPDYTRSLNFSSLRGARIGIPRNGLKPENISQPVLDAFEAAIQVIKNAGAIIVDNANFSGWEELLADEANAPSSEDIVLGADFVSDLSSYLGQLTSNPNQITSLAGAASFTHSSKLESYPTRDTAIWDEALSLGYNSSDYRFWKAFERTSYFGGEGGVTGALAAFHLDALILPTDSAPNLPAYAGLPVVTVPMGYYPSNSSVLRTPNWELVEVGPNIPFGLSFMGAKWSEETLIGFAYAYEQRTHTRSKVRPYIVPNVQLQDVI
ncbi:amidase, partial [Hyphodiscus hymeniophilus]